jgi:hypothetical protein
VASDAKRQGQQKTNGKNLEGENIVAILSRRRILHPPLCTTKSQEEGCDPKKTLEPAITPARAVSLEALVEGGGSFLMLSKHPLRMNPNYVSMFLFTLLSFDTNL